MNPEEPSKFAVDITARTMYDYDMHKNIPWNMTQYDPKKQYLDPAEQILQRKYSVQKRGQKPTVRATKKGFFMEYDLKVAGAVPGPNKYKLHDSWDGTILKKKSLQKKLDTKIIKRTYIEQIQLEQKNRKKPGVCTYNLCKTEGQVKDELKILSQKKLSQNPKRYFYQDTEYRASVVPGAGAHNPHEIRSKKSLNRTEPKFWIAKHKKQNEVQRKRRASEPAAGTYKPLPTLYTTFTQISEIPKQKLARKNGFGGDEKFAYMRASKIKNKIKEVRPSVATYNTFIDWPLKTDKAGEVNKHKFNWHNRISRGFSQSVYH